MIFLMDPAIAQESIIDSTILLSDSATIDGTFYSAILKTNDTVYIIDEQGNIDFKLPGYGYDLEFKDFDHDGFKDLVISHLGNVPGIIDLVKYDSESKSFHYVDLTLYPDPQWIDRTKYYYSYHRSGCADYNWDSDLFYIEDYKIYRIGNIAGRDCGNDTEEKGIFIYRVENNISFYLEKKPVSILNDYQDYKWGFIRDYWTGNLGKFTQ
jgi:hypothetical protein